MAKSEKGGATEGVTIDAVLFDLDGVLVRSDEYHYRGWKRLADDEGWDFDKTLNHQLRGVSRMDSLQVILDHNNVEVSEERKKELADRKNGYYRASLADMDEGAYIPGAQQLLEELKDRKVYVAVCSSSRNAPFILEVLGISDIFDTVVSGHDIERAKPDPQIFQLAADRLQVPYERCVVFEDAESGIEAAINAGMYSVGVGDKEHLPNAEVVVEDLSGISVDRLIREGRP
jgi:beta-phosphoglucomutase